jgi:hypothetical protein
LIIQRASLAISLVLSLALWALIWLALGRLHWP